MDNRITQKDYLLFATIILGILVGLWIQPFMFVSFFFCVYFVLTRPIQRSFYLIFFIMPFALIFKFRNYDLSFLTIIQILIIFDYFIIKKQSLKKYFLIPFAIMLSYFILRMGSYYISILKIAVTCLFVYVFIDSNKKRRGDYVTLLKVFITGLIVSSLIGILKPYVSALSAYYTDLNYQYIAGKRTLRFSGLFSDPNYYAISIVLSLLVLSFLKFTNHIKSIPFFFFYIILFVFGIMTYSKSFIIMFAVCLLVELFLNLKLKKHLLFSFELLLALSILFVMLFGNSTVLSRNFARFVSGQDLTSTRDIIWKNYLHEIQASASSILFGHTLGAKYVFGKAAHNLYIELVYYSGIIGLILYVCFWALMVLSNHSHLKNKIVFVVPLSVLAMFFFLSGFLNYAFPFYIIISWVALQIMENYEHRVSFNEKNLVRI